MRDGTNFQPGVKRKTETKSGRSRPNGGGKKRLEAAVIEDRRQGGGEDR